MGNGENEDNGGRGMFITRVYRRRCERPDHLWRGRHPQRTGAERLGAVCRRADQYRIGTSPRQAPVPLTFRGDSCDLIL